MKSPLERAARALYRLHDAPPQDLLDRLKASADEEGLAEELAEEDEVWPNYVADARAVLEAIRDVDAGSPAILVAGKESLYSCSEDPELEDARKCFHAMIDAALKEG
ncbi:hypothetical protein [Sphingopyxis sp. 550A]